MLEQMCSSPLATNDTWKHLVLKLSFFFFLHPGTLPKYTHIRSPSVAYGDFVILNGVGACTSLTLLLLGVLFFCRLH